MLAPVSDAPDGFLYFSAPKQSKTRESRIENPATNSQWKGIKMISNATQRSILRWIHIIVTIPVFGYIYGPASEVQQYADGVRYIFVPIIVLRDCGCMQA